ncbi:FdtA/QdtA family cupin domain-containing protein [Marinobacter sp. chi1]|uniref:FdtA/QdtA family cupin domain-containing protein n=1 Tax=Marinobacter suaedae TaxID=3057675 RepID=A0ABT8VWG2_9GAMM|nr:FdtA/QdtA family cupin domain-containing protein [Marinobacter sp. chi1]MDO3720328.1 FdtA/QdtA family cupin domain-containing protein [Marinobacter sp. chi1]
MSLVKLTNLPDLGDDRGGLVAIEESQTIPFPIKRVYYIYGTKSGTARGFHAHKALQQVAICIAGKCNMLLDDGNNRDTVELGSPNSAVAIEPMVWHEMHDFTDDCVLLVLASDHYDENDYIRDYDAFLTLVKQ